MTEHFGVRLSVVCRPGGATSAWLGVKSPSGGWKFSRDLLVYVPDPESPPGQDPDPLALVEAAVAALRRKAEG